MKTLQKVLNGEWKHLQFLAMAVIKGEIAGSSFPGVEILSFLGANSFLKSFNLG